MPVNLPESFVSSVRQAVGPGFVREDAEALEAYGVDALQQGHPPDLVVIPGNAQEISAIARLCTEHRVPLVVRGAGTGYTGGAVPTAGGLVLSMERLNRILEIDELNLLAVVEPNVITADLQRAVEAVGLFYPPDPASLEKSSLGGNVAECAGGPRAFKYGTTKRYVLALEAVLPTGEIVHTGSKAVKNVVGYDLTQLLVGSEGTLAIVTQITLRLVPKPPAYATLLASFRDIASAVDAVSALIRRRVVPAAIELVDDDSLRAAQEYAKTQVAPEGAHALLIVESDGTSAGVAEEIARVEEACASAGALGVHRADSDAERARIWSVRRDISLALRATGLLKINHDVVVPRGRVPELFETVATLKRDYALRVAAFGHAGDGNIHVNLMVDPASADEVARARAAERVLFERVVALEGSISGEHGIGFAKRPYLGLELSADEIALMKRVKAAFDPANILNPGKIFP
ncbi:MAG TPA: FAD-linked oxidase C-terminal domain-containing protein [Vicinamibacterales bacterium]|nr:FAD-linked oxidase C-terminal domain-containing protein [Vicinamibacterales bacterium]